MATFSFTGVPYTCTAGVCPLPINERHYFDAFNFPPIDPGWKEYGLVPNGQWFIEGGKLRRNVEGGSGSTQLLRAGNFDPTQINYVEQFVEVYWDAPGGIRLGVWCCGETNSLDAWTLQINGAAYYLGLGGVFDPNAHYLGEIATGDTIGTKAYVQNYVVDIDNTRVQFNWIIEPFRNGISLGFYPYSQPTINFCQQWSGLWRSQNSEDIAFDNYNFNTGTATLFQISYPNYTTPGETTQAYNWTLTDGYGSSESVAVVRTGGTVPVTYAVTAGSLPAFWLLNSGTGEIQHPVGVAGGPTGPGSFEITATDSSATPQTAVTTVTFIIVP